MRCMYCISKEAGETGYCDSCLVEIIAEAPQCMECNAPMIGFWMWPKNRVAKHCSDECRGIAQARYMDSITDIMLSDRAIPMTQAISVNIALDMMNPDKHEVN